MIEFIKILGSFILGSICGYEYKSWRERSAKIKEEKKEALNKLRAELKTFTINWRTFRISEKSYLNPALKDIQDKLASTSNLLRRIVSEKEKLLPKEIIGDAITISSELEKLSRKQFFIDGGKSLREFLEAGDKLVERCEKLILEIDKLS